MRPLISFVVTYHNEPKALLDACVESILALPFTEGEAEIVVVDDGSSPPLLEEWPSVRLYRQEQAGLSAARNVGISQTHGSYIQFVDADDCLIPQAYDSVLEQVRKEVADVVMFKMTSKSKIDCRIVKSSDCGVVKLSDYKIVKSAWFLLHRNLRAAACGYAFRRDIMGDLRFCPGLLHEDELFTPLLFLRASTLVELEVKAYFYLQHEGTITHSKSLEQIQRRLNDMHFIINELHSIGNPLLERRQRQLTLDYLQKTWVLTHSLRELRHRARQLRQEGFLPLPVRFYSMRYLLASFLF